MKHARNIGGRFPEGEAIIAQDPCTAYHYAVDVIRGRWPEGEFAIAKSTTYAYLYVSQIIRCRWLEGEAAIAEDELLWEAYNKKFALYVNVDWTKEGF